MPARDCRVCCCAGGVELRVYMVRNGISYVPGYARMCSRIQGYAESSLEEVEEDELPCECISYCCVGGGGIVKGALRGNVNQLDRQACHSTSQSRIVSHATASANTLKQWRGVQDICILAGRKLLLLWRCCGRPRCYRAADLPILHHTHFCFIGLFEQTPNARAQGIASKLRCDV